jgi:hypothetical protein
VQSWAFLPEGAWQGDAITCRLTENEPKEQQVTRETLYELVWAKPIRTVAAEIGISNVGLAKACDRLNVPRPAVGHWVRLEHGRKTERPPLPPATPGQETMLVIKPPSAAVARSKQPGAPKPNPQRLSWRTT